MTMNPPTQPTVEEVVEALRRVSAHFACDAEYEHYVEFSPAVTCAISLLSALEKDALRYRYFRSLWERIEWQHGSVEGYDVVNDDKTVASDCNWGDERIGRALDTAIDLARGQS